MKVPLRVLHVDDNPVDVRLVQAFLAVSGIECDVVRVDTGPALEAALHQGGFDLILSDCVLPAFDGFHAPALVQQVCPGMPFIVVSGMLNDTAASRILTCGRRPMCRSIAYRSCRIPFGGSFQMGTYPRVSLPNIGRRRESTVVAKCMKRSLRGREGEWHGM